MENKNYPTEWVEITCDSALTETAERAFGFVQTRTNEPTNEVTGIIYGNPDTLTERLDYAAHSIGGHLLWNNPINGISARFIPDSNDFNPQQ